MPVTAIADIIDPEVLGDQASALWPDKLVVGNSSLVAVDTEFPLGSPGTKFKMPFWKRIAAFGNLAEGTPMTTNKITAGAEHCTVIRGGNAYEVYDTAALVSKADPTAEIAGQIANVVARYVDDALVGRLNLTPNKYDYSAVGAGTMTQDAIINGLITYLGDNYAEMIGSGAIIMHSKVYGDLLKLGAIQNTYQSGMDVLKTGLIPTLLGLPIMLSDRVSTTTISGVTHYYTYVVGPQSLALFHQRGLKVEFDRDILLQADIIAATIHFAPHLFGYDDVTAAIVAQDNKSVTVVRIQTK